jgi:hypothetical protein
MKKKISIIMVIGMIVLGLTGCREKNEDKSSEVLENHGDILISIEKVNLDCVTVMLTLYDDNQYELFTDYATCREEESCSGTLKYTKSIKGTYHYDIDQIIESATNANDKSYTNDDHPEYSITLGEQYILKYDSLEYTVEVGQTNTYLNELLNQLNIDLNQCATADYVE